MLLSLTCQSRPPKTNPRQLRRSGLIPATVYGHKGAESTAIAVKAKDLELMMRRHRIVVGNTLIDLQGEDIDLKEKTLLQDMQTNPCKNEIYHLSFFAISNQKSIELTIPLHYVGVAAGVKAGGSMRVLMNEIQVACPPHRIIERLDVEVSHLEVGKGIHVGELQLPEGIKAISDPSALVVTIMRK
ncbi:MAG: 50S ribosomal protein L25 [Pseudanabaenaceae cyanobacterium]